MKSNKDKDKDKDNNNEEGNNIRHRVLFICKKRNDTYGPSFGLINSCKFICNALSQHGIDCKVVSVIDNNVIDKEVHNFNPTHVFIEALWVVPSKFEVLLKLHEKVKWYVRIHSKIPFIANEGIAIQWLREYNEISNKYKNFNISANNTDIIDIFGDVYGINILYHPNIYCPPDYEFKSKPKLDTRVIDIGCFGAVRPMKNHLEQAMSSMAFGNEINKRIRFHVNGDRIEQKGDSVMKNLEYAFKNTKHELVKHPWVNHEEFVKLVRKMDIGMQVSFSETFNIVAADFVWNGIPVIGSPEVSWLSRLYQADPTDFDGMIRRLYLVYHGIKINLQSFNLCKLKQYNKDAVEIWLEGI